MTKVHLRPEVLYAVVDQMWNAVVITSGSKADHYAVQYANPAFLGMTGYTLDELLGRPLTHLQGPDTDQAVIDELKLCLERGSFFEGQTFNYKKGGERYFVRWNISAIRNDIGEIVNYVSVQTDLSELRASQGRNLLLEEVLQVIPDPILMTNEGLEIGFCNLAARNLFDCHVGQNLTSILVQTMSVAQLRVALHENGKEGNNGVGWRVVLEHRGSSGSSIFIDHSVRPVSNEATGAQDLILVGKDISNHIEREENLSKEAKTDALTGLFNRGHGEELLKSLIQGKVLKTSPIAVASIDIDHFKSINDTYGHSVGDDVIRSVANTILKTVRLNDHVIRWGGEEFLVIFTDVSSIRPPLLADRIRVAVATTELPAVGGVTVSVGVGTPHIGEKHDELLKRVDAALYEAKARGRNNTCQAAEGP